MHDLNTIVALNAQAAAQAVSSQFHGVDLDSTLLGTLNHLRQQGRYVVASYDGLHLTAIESFSREEDALAVLRAPTTVGEHRHFYAPILPVKTLGDYVTQKSEVASGHATRSGADAGVPIHDETR